MAGPLVERGQCRTQARGIALLGRQCTGARRELAQCLGPPRRRVRDDDGVQSHVTEVLRHGEAGVDARLTGHHRHVRRVRDDDGALCQPAPGTGIDKLRELGDHVCHLVPALSAADVDDDVRSAPLRHLLQQHGLPGAEPAGNRRRAAERHRVEQVEHPLTRHQRLPTVQSTTVRAWQAHRPALRHPDGRTGDHGHGRVGSVASGRLHLLDASADACGHQDPHGQRTVVMHGPDGVAGLNDVAHGDEGLEPPLAQIRWCRSSGGQPRAGPEQRTQQAVEHAAEQRRTQGRGQRLAQSAHGMSRREPAGVLVCLRRRHSARDGDDLARDA